MKKPVINSNSFLGFAATTLASLLFSGTPLHAQIDVNFTGSYSDPLVALETIQSTNGVDPCTATITEPITFVTTTIDSKLFVQARPEKTSESAN